MKRSINIFCFSLLILVMSLWPHGHTVQAQVPVVRAILFYSPTCPHCHTVMTEDLPPLVDQYGEQLYMLAIDTSTQQGRDLYIAATAYYQIPVEQQGVPLLIVGETVLMGSLQIPQQFPGIIEEGLAANGIDWPTLPELREILEAQGLLQLNIPAASSESAEQPAAEEASAPSNLLPGGANALVENLSTEEPTGISANVEEAAMASSNMTPAQRFAQDRGGNTLAVVVLAGIVMVLAWAGYAFTHPGKKYRSGPNWIVPLLALAGMGVALYMGYVEITQTEAVCGPVGNCNAVQQSEYAYLFGLVPIGVLGVVGYAVIGATWLMKTYGPTTWQQASTMFLWLLALVGTLFSIYLTFLEPFIIGASCAWCLTSAVLMALLLWTTTQPVTQARLLHGR